MRCFSVGSMRRRTNCILTRLPPLCWSTSRSPIIYTLKLTEAQAGEMTDEVLEDTIWESVRPREEQWESLKVNESKVVEQELYDEDRQTRFWRRRPDGFTVNRKEHIIYVLEFKRVSDTCERYVSETQKLAEIQRRDTRSQKTVQGYTMDS
jgi:hypothetical protein